MFRLAMALAVQCLATLLLSEAAQTIKDGSTVEMRFAQSAGGNACWKDCRVSCETRYAVCMEQGGMNCWSQRVICLDLCRKECL
jgi:hypothetical protein